MTDKAIQDYYPPELAHCYGCGNQNSNGHQLKSYWDGERAVARYRPRPEHTAIPGYVYGGLIASLIDCHGTGTASAAAHAAQGRPLGSEPPLRYVTAALEVNYLAPTPMGVELQLVGRPVELTDRKVVVEITLHAGDTACATGRVVAVRMPRTMLAANPDASVTDRRCPEDPSHV